MLHVTRKSLSIEELYLDNLGLKADFSHKLAMAVAGNEATPLHTLDLSNNMIEDKGWFYAFIILLSNILQRFSNILKSEQKNIIDNSEDIAFTGSILLFLVLYINRKEGKIHRSKKCNELVFKIFCFLETNSSSTD